MFDDGADPYALLERSASGFHVTLSRRDDTLYLTCYLNEHAECAKIAPDKALDAFQHPTCYLSDAQVSALFARKVEA